MEEEIMVRREEMKSEYAQIDKLIEKIDQSYQSKITLDVEFRRSQLKKLVEMLEKSEELFIEAIRSDYKKPVACIKMELYMCIAKIKNILYYLDSWVMETKVDNDMVNYNARLSTIYQPLGKVLIICPWNFPILLSIEPLAGAISAGNTAMVKTSELAPITGRLLESLASRYLDESCYTFVSTPNCGPYLVSKKFDLIFFTGSSRVGRSVYQAASATLTPVVLELGGMCPSYIHKDVSIKSAVEKILLLKVYNAGQVCVGINHLYCHRSILEQVVEQLKVAIKQFYGESVKSSPHYGRIVSTLHTERLKTLIDTSRSELVHGGEVDVEERYVEPSLFICEKSSKLLKEEIFGPLLPIIPVDEYEEAVEEIRKSESPLEVYLFTHDQLVKKKFLHLIPSGGLTINASVNRMAALSLPFGGVGSSGMGRSVGYEGFKSFSSLKSIYHETVSISKFSQVLQPPYTSYKESLIRWLLTGFNCRIL